MTLRVPLMTMALRGVAIAALIPPWGTACGSRAVQQPPQSGEVPTTCWSLTRTFHDPLHLPPDTAVVPSAFELAVTADGLVVVLGSPMRGRWTSVTADSVRIEWGEGRQRTWLFGTVSEGRLAASGHVFGAGGASALVSYEGRRVTCARDVDSANRNK